ncbi:hypothetical protein BCR32DRAFT_280886 [Anaeromyces robustus]|uniref:Serpin domain-containing protein n=1 Tax=Anaeromyces robustus TaxID=1754192 RepID=A0A1Y1X328_9FUNG|nr:hypothetical protein BCR32DRAFT_280886 [Anaeromyces robustus]|eukprot:ORX80038.1 hypothetical protein BCR32DRAFT_280886 [Anaeromyces robustus]
MLSDDIVQDPSIAMLLVNALAIDMEWEYRFDCKDIHGEIFIRIMNNNSNNNVIGLDSFSY